MSQSYQRILVPLDGSERAAAALSHAETLASLAKAHLILLQVIPSSAMLISESAISAPSMGLPTVDPFVSSAQYQSVEQALAQEAQKSLDEAVAPLRANAIDVETVILQGTPAEAILTYATDNKIDLIVMSTHGRTGLTRIVFGSVAESVLRRSPCPVLLVRVASE